MYNLWLDYMKIILFEKEGLKWRLKFEDIVGLANSLLTWDEETAEEAKEPQKGKTKNRKRRKNAKE